MDICWMQRLGAGERREREEIERGSKRLGLGNVSGREERSGSDGGLVWVEKKGGGSLLEGLRG